MSVKIRVNVINTRNVKLDEKMTGKRIWQSFFDFFRFFSIFFSIFSLRKEFAKKKKLWRGGELNSLLAIEMGINGLISSIISKFDQSEAICSGMNGV